MSSSGARSGSVDAGGQPARRSQEPRVALIGADELDAERQAVRALHEGQAHRGHPAQRPRRAEGRVPGRPEAGRARGPARPASGSRRSAARTARAGSPGGPHAGDRELIVEGADLAPALEPGPQWLRQAVAPVSPHRIEVRGHLRVQDRPVPAPGLGRRRSQLDLLDPVAQVLDQLREGRARLLVGARPTGGSGRTRAWAGPAAPRRPPLRRESAPGGAWPGSPSSNPTSSPARRARSSTVRAKRPTRSSVAERGASPRRGISPRLGVKPYTPQYAAEQIDRSLGLAAEGQGHHGRGDRGRRSARRPSRRAGRIVRIARLAGGRPGPFRGRGLAEDDRAGRPQHGHRAPRPATAGARRAGRVPCSVAMSAVSKMS